MCDSNFTCFHITCMCNCNFTVRKFTGVLHALLPLKLGNNENNQTENNDSYFLQILLTKITCTIGHLALSYGTM